MRTSQLAAIFLISIVITLCYQQAEAQTYYFATPLDGEVFTEGIDLEVIVNASHPDGIKNVRLYLDEVHIRKESVDPYRWHSGQDPALAAMSAGDYTLRALITTKLDETAVMSIGITIGELVEPSEPPAPPDPPQGPCELCFGWDVDVAIDNDTIQSCVTWATTATEHEVVYEDGPSHIEVGCLVEIAIFPEVRVHVRANDRPRPENGVSVDYFKGHVHSSSVKRSKGQKVKRSKGARCLRTWALSFLSGSLLSRHIMRDVVSASW